MDLDPGPGADDDLTVRLAGLPVRGLKEVLSRWSVGGHVLDHDELDRVLSLASGDVDSPDWLPRDIRRRAARTAWDRLLAPVERLPDSERTWHEALPALTITSRVVSSRPLRPTDWGATVRRNRSWPVPPPQQPVFVGRVRERATDSLLLTVLRWVKDRLPTVRRDAGYLHGPIRTEADAQVQALGRLELPDGLAIAPDEADLQAVHGEGAPWSDLADVAARLLDLEGNLYEYAARLLCPDAELRGALFHLAVYGELLAILRAEGFDVVSTAPLTGGAKRPTHEATRPNGRVVEVWFEASGCWSWYGSGAASTAYAEATAGLVAGTRPLSPDCLLVDVTPGTPVAAFLVECKESANSNYVGRDGYLQALAYGVQVARSAICPVTALVVGPEKTVLATSMTSALHGLMQPPVTLGSSNPQLLEAAVLGWL